MPSSHVQTPAAHQAAPSPRAALDALAVIAIDHVRRELGRTAARLGAALADVDGDGAGLDTRTIYQRIKSARLLKEQGYAFFHLAAEGIAQALRAELDRLDPHAARPVPAALGLVPLEEIDDRLALAALARPFDIAHAEALAVLSVRLGLLLGRGVLRADANPFRPAVFLAALDAAWRAFEPDELAHDLARPLLGPAVVFDFAPLLDALAADLRQRGRPEGAACRIQKTDDAAAARAARAGRKAALAGQLRRLFGDADANDDDDADCSAGMPLVPDLPHLPAGNGGWRPSAAAGFQAVPARAEGMAAAATGAAPATVSAPTSMAAPLSGRGPGAAAVPAAAAATVPTPQAGAAPLADLLARIDAVLPAAAPDDGAGGACAANVFYLPRLRRSLPEGSLAHADARTLDLLARVFEAVLLDDDIPADARTLLQALQLPVLKAALLDRSFFFEDSHPARRLVDLLSRMGWERRADPADPVFQAMRRSVAAVDGAGAGAMHSAAQANAVFATALADLEAVLAARAGADEAALRSAIAGPVASAERQERLEAATRAARDAVGLRIAAGDLGEGFAGAVGSFLEQRWTTVMTFAYSIEETRPGAVGNATRAMDDLIWSVRPKPTQEQRKDLIARLPRLLATLNKWLDAIQWRDAARLEFFAGLAACHAAIVRAPIALSPERQLELAVEAARQDALRRVELERAAEERAAAHAAEQAAAWSPLDGLERGLWLEFRADGAARKARLAWVSPLRTLFIFSGPDRQEAFSLPARELAEALHAGRARVLAIDGLVGQVLSEAMRGGAVNDGAAARQAG
ncbi:DUF1631 family protein [uncultured Massilia sp.]|uniref:DUF1631 family protein n=1 Tax=uncultured Massilia sp. TaxID=169973 RepID=UPI0025FB8861|nr:DUF1631 family protein [uncultured Massilia sp.]